MGLELVHSEKGNFNTAKKFKKTVRYSSSVQDPLGMRASKGSITRHTKKDDKMKFTEAEKQLLIVMGYFKSNPPDTETLRGFGERNIGEYLVAWDEAYTRLIKKGLLQKKDNTFSLTELGETHRKAVEKNNPLWLYEYNTYFARAEKSDAHKIFCEKVYGKNLCQHGIADMHQLETLLHVLDVSENDSVLDLGCGNGLITAYLSEASGASFTGIDLSEEAIKQARKIAKKDRLNFQRGNMNDLNFDENTFDAVVSIDTLYFVDDLEEVMNQLLKIVKSGGQMGIFYTQWIENETAEMLLPEHTELGVVLKKYDLEYETLDFTKAEVKHWQKKVKVLEELKPEFEKEGSLELYEYRYDEATYYEKWNPEKRSRHLYHVFL